MELGTCDTMGIFGLSLHEKLAYALAHEIDAGLDKAQWRNLSEAILPVYQEAVLNQGYTIYVYTTEPGPTKEASTKTVLYVADETKIDPVLVNEYLYMLERMANTGTIDLKHYNPVAERETATTFKWIPEGVTRALEKVDVFEAAEKQYNKLLILGGILGVAAIVIFSKTKYVRAPALT